VLNFHIDDRVGANVREAIGDALKLGALVYSEKTDGEFLKDGIAKAKSRICYLLAAEYNLPFIKGKSRTASFIMQEEHVSGADEAEALPLFPNE
jgi:hypothetical protein